MLAKGVEAILWYRSLVDIIRPYKIRREGDDKTLIIKALTMIVPETGWFETMQYENKQADTIAKLSSRSNVVM